ncbi:SAM-dependent methyltransferase [Microbacterium sp. CFH 90308]|uniref:SAM-dependent methyltransferase n=1 Tax=Microbacterium salsuginis TaxID=2722803 RepID=A0ABX1K9L3_9MICO|nr:SAM-dependent methyltransferase [Microbacterium sp. CFH 90308]NLP83360.1 SAM-dependent methyltransferase [Microbacterium sp. CFH 90308]
MSVVIPVSADWLTLREDADAGSRSRALAVKAGRMLRPPVVVHDLGTGTGSMVRWSAPLLPGPQTWVLHDWNDALLQHAAAAAAHDRDGRAVAVRTRAGELGLLQGADLAGASLVTASALLDVLSADEVGAVVAACIAAGAPALFALSVTGRVTLDPIDPGDGVFEAAFNDHQRRLVEDRHLLGPDAATVVADLFRAAGWSVRVADSPWRLEPGDAALITEWLDGWLAAAVAQRPALREWAAEYARMRMAQLAADRLRVVVHHVDLLAWPS